MAKQRSANVATIDMCGAYGSRTPSPKKNVCFIVDEQSRKKQDPNCYTKQQLSEVHDARCAMFKTVVELARKHLAASVEECATAFLHALSHDGYIEMPFTDDCEEKLRGALARATLEAYLMPPPFYKHPAWHSIEQQVSWKKVAILMVDVMSALLAPTQAWTVFDQEKTRWIASLWVWWGLR